MSAVNSQRNSIVRDLRTKRLYQPGVSGCYRFNATFASPPEVPLAVQRNYFEGGEDIGVHRGEDFYSLYIVRGGRGVEIVDDHPYVITRGDVYVIPPGLPHGFRDYEELEMDAFYFQTKLFSRAELGALHAMEGFWKLFLIHHAVRDATKAAPKQRGRYCEHRLHLTPEQHRQIEQSIEEIRFEIDQPSALGPLLARGLFFQLLAALARWQEAHVPAKSPSKFHAQRINDAVRFCEANFGENISVSQLAARAFLSVEHFSSLFTAEAGMPPAAYVRRLRLEHAQTLLRTTDTDITEVARQAGFGGLAQLSRAFRNQLGMTPSAYRQRYK